MTDEVVRNTDRRRFLRALGVSAIAPALAGCSSGEDDPSPTDGGPGGGEGTPTDDGSADSADDTPTAGDDSSTGSAPATGAGGVRTPTAGEDRDWDAVAAREEASMFDLPDEAPTAFGFTRVASENELTVSYGSMTGSDPVESGTLYVVLAVDGSAEGVVVWEPPIEDGDGFLVGPDGSALAMDVAPITAIVFAWEYQGELYVVDKKDEVL